MASRKKQTKAEAIEELQRKIATATGVRDIHVHLRGCTPDAIPSAPCTECPPELQCIVVTFTPVSSKRIRP
jgi:hypothetical protein